MISICNRYRKVITVFFLFIYLNSLVPVDAFALTSGPHQPEFTSYEEPGAKDMVNLATGDFAYNLPVISVPGPEGNFDVPLTYNAGIGLDQEASWVGLGFNVNVGSLVRSINSYPDDASGEVNQVTVQNWNVTKGWHSNMALLQLGWNNQVGHYGSASLFDIVNVGWNHGIKSVGVVGTTFSEKGVKFDAGQALMAVMSIASFGSTGATAGAAGKSVAGAIAKQAAIEAAVGIAIAGISGAPGPSIPTQGYWEPTKDTDRKPFRTEYKIWLDKTRQEEMFGSLHLGKVQYTLGYAALNHTLVYANFQDGAYDLAPEFKRSTETTAIGSASDINANISNGSFELQNEPSTMASDNFRVNAPSISGGIKPYRLDFGTLALPREMSESHVRIAPVKFLDYKVPFIYDGMPSNSYYHHVGKNIDDGLVTDPTVNWGLTSTLSKCEFCSVANVELYLKDRIFDKERMRADVSGTKKLAQANNVEWLTNEEIKNAITYQSKLLDFASGGAVVSANSDRSKFRTNPMISTSTNPNGIGGFVITNSGGMNFHFALPVLDRQFYTEVYDVSDANKRSEIKRDAPFANTWLITAITGSDYIDRNSNGMADDGDWGYWVKFNYGKHSNDFQWRDPWYTTTPAYRNDGKNQGRSRMSGVKQIYYLNSIETRSHVALFIKSERLDGRSGDMAPLLKLDEIALLKKSIYNNLRSSYSVSDFLSTYNATSCLTTSFTIAAKAYLDRNVERKVKFNYDYQLCKNTPNSTETNKGKLTLTRLSYCGINNEKVMPDYLFSYGYNPNYSAHHYDGWGLYNPIGSSSGLTHSVDQVGTYGPAWSLTKITSPLGAELFIDYERDTYSSISGEEVLNNTSSSYFRSQYSQPYYPDVLRKLTYNHGGSFVVGDQVRINGSFTCQCANGPLNNNTVNDRFTIMEVGVDYLVVDHDIVPVVCNPYGTSIQFANNSLLLTKILPNKKGGDLRVSAIRIKNESGVEQKIRYLYTNDDGSSTGVIAQEPEYERKNEFDFYNWVNYPDTPVLYKKVTVLQGKLSTDTDFHTKIEYQFETPHRSNIVQTTTDKVPLYADRGHYLRAAEHIIHDYTSKIGSLTSVTVKDKSNQIVSSTVMNYSEEMKNKGINNYQGFISQGTMRFDIVKGANGSYYSQVGRTTVIKHPSVVKFVTDTKDGFVTKTENNDFDLYTAQVLDETVTTSLGVRLRTILTPAYEVYPELGLKGTDVTKKNMLGAIAAAYTYRVDNFNNSLGLLNAEVQTWRSDWTNYRHFNGTEYEDFNDAASQANPVWRKGATFFYKGDLSKYNTEEGVFNFTQSNKFNFAPNSSNPGWHYVGEVTKFDHFGMPLSAVDYNGFPAAVRMGYDDQIVVARAKNAAFHEIAFSSAEDLYSDKPFFGSEVAKGNGTVLSASKSQFIPANTGGSSITGPHTGDAALVLSTGTGFVFKTKNLSPTKSYRVNVWSNSPNGAIYYKINTGTLVESTAPSKQVGQWYAHELKFNVTSSTDNVEIGVKSKSGTVVFDDFRFQPDDAEMDCYVFNPLNFEFTSDAVPLTTYAYVLDNQNMFVKYEFNKIGFLTKTYVELKEGVKLVTEETYNYRRSTVNP